MGGLNSDDYGKALPDWPGENYIDIRHDSVWQVMKGRIELAAQKNCDAVDPDNMGKVSLVQTIFRYLIHDRWVF